MSPTRTIHLFGALLILMAPASTLARRATSSTRCLYIAQPAETVVCDGDTLSLTEYRDALGSAACPSTYVLDGVSYPSELAARTAEACFDDCPYGSATGCLLMDICGHKGGGNYYRSSDPNCPAIYEIGGDLYVDPDDYFVEHPCPEAGSTSDAAY